MAISNFTLPQHRTSSAGAYFAVLASGFVALLFLLLIFDRLGSSPARLTLAFVTFPAAIILLIGSCNISTDLASFQNGHRTSPAVLGAVSSLAATLGGIGLVALPGAFFFLGFDALPFTDGILFGLLLHAVLIAPFARKDGAYSVAGFIGRRFNSTLLRIGAAVAFTLPCLLLMTAEFKLAAFLLAHALSVDVGTVVFGLSFAAAAAIALAGMKGAIWGGTASGLIALIALLISASLAGLLTINIPLPQIAFGLARNEISRLELAAGMSTHPASAMVLTLPSGAPAALVKPFMQPFVANDPVSFVLLTLTIAFGFAALPVLFSRAGTVPNVTVSRRMSLWLICLAGAVAITLPAIGFITRLALLHALPASGTVEFPVWLDALSKLGLADFDRDATVVPINAIHFTRDSTGMLLPLVLGLPRPLADMMLASVVAVALAAIAAQAMALATMWGEDLAFVWVPPGQREPSRLLAGRILAVAATLSGGWLASHTRADPLTLFTWAMALAGSSGFAVLVMSVWWKRLNEFGALAGLIVGTLTALTLILLSLNGATPLIFGISGAIASILAVPLAAAVAIGTSLLTPPPASAVIDRLREVRLAGGETLLDHEVRFAKLKMPAGK